MPAPRTAFLAMVLAAGSASAAEPRWFALTPDVTRNLVLRAEPANAGRRIGEIPAGATGIENKGCRGASEMSWEHLTPEIRSAMAKERWCRVRHRNVEGWVAARFLRPGSPPPPDSMAGDDAPAKSGPGGRRLPATTAGLAPPGRPVAGRSDAPFTGIEWRAAMIGNIELRESLAWIRFSASGELEGHTGCNVIRGSYTSGETALRIALVMVTRMACLGDTMAAQERLMLSALESVEAQQVMGGVLRLYGQGGVAQAVFRAAGR